MKYITRKPAKFKAITGKTISIPAYKPLEAKEVPNVGILLYYKDQPICAVGSEISHQYCAYDDDGQGKQRGKLIDSITALLETRDDDYQKRWDKLWESSQANALRREDYEDFWVWGEKFYQSPVLMLNYIQGLISNV